MAASALALLLAACGDDPEPAPVPIATDGSAQGEVLQGTISDAMLPLDTVQSEPPPRVEPVEDTSDAAADGAQ